MHKSLCSGFLILCSGFANAMPLGLVVLSCSCRPQFAFCARDLDLAKTSLRSTLCAQTVTPWNISWTVYLPLVAKESRRNVPILTLSKEASGEDFCHVCNVTLGINTKTSIAEFLPRTCSKFPNALELQMSTS